uniref:Tyrosine specific protein phosphatases domain-containing protein n=1 Tax=Sinocyclocheilus rhinocerous TaxID=307959 RepID=A0A673H2Y7_9TELE
MQMRSLPLPCAQRHPLVKLEKTLFGEKRSRDHVDEVWPNLYLGESVANDGFSVWKLGITRVLNAAHGKMHFPADDSPSFSLSVFHPCTDYIRERVLVQCAAGVSRSASLVLAHLMIHQHLSLLEAIKAVKPHCWIFPN